MSSQGQQTILTLAEKYGLQEGKNADYYLCHSTWVLTKTGAEKIKQAEEIKHSFPVPSHSPDGTSVAYMATFTSKEGAEEHEIGSCRTDGTVNNPAKTHSHEMALKRLKVRGILAIVAPAGQVYGVDELTDEYKQHGNGAITDSAPQPQQAIQQVQPQQQAQPQATAPVANSGNFQIPPEGTKGWVNNGEQLPSDWNDLMGKLAELTGQDRVKHERNVYDHVSQWNMPDGGIWTPSSKFPTFGQWALGFKEWQGERKYNAYGALQALGRARDLVTVLAENGSVECSQANGRGGFQMYTIYTKQANPEFQAGANAELLQEYGEDVVGNVSDPDVPF